MHLQHARQGPGGERAWLRRCTDDMTRGGGGGGEIKMFQAINVCARLKV